MEFTVTPSTLQYGTAPVTVTIIGAGANEVVDCGLTLPSGEIRKLSFTCDATGSFSAPLLLSSGEGVYIFAAWTGADPCGIPVPPCNPFSVTIVASRCAVTPGERHLEIYTAQDFAQPNTAVVIWVGGALPGSTVFLHTPTGGTLAVVPVVVDMSGIGSISHTLGTTATTFVATQDTTVSNTLSISVAPDINTPPTLLASPDLAVTFKDLGVPRLPGEFFPVLASITNLTSESQLVSLTSLTGDLASAPINKISMEPIGAGHTRNFTLYVSGEHARSAEATLSATAEFSYNNDNSTMQATLSAQIPARELISLVEITSFVAEPFRQTLGNPVVFLIEITNLGESALTDVCINSTPIADALGVIAVDGLSLLPGQKYRTSINVIPSKRGDYVTRISSTDVSAVGQGKLVVATQDVETHFKVV